MSLIIKCKDNMFELENKKIKEFYRSALPRGSKKEIAKRAGVSVQSVSYFLNTRKSNKGTTLVHSPKIELEIIKYIHEIHEARKEMFEMLKDFYN